MFKKERLLHGAKYPVVLHDKGNVIIRTLIYKKFIPGEGGTKKLIRGGSAPSSDPFPLYVPFLAEKIPLTYTAYTVYERGIRIPYVTALHDLPERNL